jgi:hypothetical protein
VQIPIPLIMLDFASIAAAVGLAYYSVRMIVMMRWGRFETSWRSITIGAVLLCVGYVVLTLEDFSPAYTIGYEVKDYLGTAISTFGILFVFVGMRQSYRVWQLKDIKPRDISVPEKQSSNEQTR